MSGNATIPGDLAGETRPRATSQFLPLPPRRNPELTRPRPPPIRCSGR